MARGNLAAVRGAAARRGKSPTSELAVRLALHPERARLPPRPGSHTRHLFPVRPKHPRRRAARQPAQDGELPAMEDVVKQDCRPQEVADLPLVAAAVLDRADQARPSEPPPPPARLCVN